MGRYGPRKGRSCPHDLEDLTATIVHFVLVCKKAIAVHGRAMKDDDRDMQEQLVQSFEELVIRVSHFIPGVRKECPLCNPRAQGRSSFMQAQEQLVQSFEETRRRSHTSARGSRASLLDVTQGYSTESALCNLEPLHLQRTLGMAKGGPQQSLLSL